MLKRRRFTHKIKSKPPIEKEKEDTQPKKEHRIQHLFLLHQEKVG
jgi:hypothetical protein